MTTDPDPTYPFTPLPARPRYPVWGTILAAAGYLLPLGMLAVGYFVVFPLFFSLPSADTSDRDLVTLLWLFVSVLYLLFTFLSWRLVRYGSALSKKDAIALVREDPRPPILYLRSFADDAVPDTRGNLLPVGLRHTVETRLVGAFKPLGPVISIGQPREALPELGANRFYVSDDEWRDAVLHFLQNARAVVILVGSTTGVNWEIEKAIQTVPKSRLLFVFPYLLPRRTGWWSGWMRYRLQSGGSRIGKKMLAEMNAEREKRYQLFVREFGPLLETDLPPELDDHVFLDFILDGRARLLPTVTPLFVRRYRDRQGVTIDYRRSLRPFLEKVLERPIRPGLVERLFTNRGFLLGTAIGSLLLGGFVFTRLFVLPPHWWGPGLLLAVFCLNYALFGIWNFNRQRSADEKRRALREGGSGMENSTRPGCNERILVGLAGGIMGLCFGWVVYNAGLTPPTAKAGLEAGMIALTDGLGGFIAGALLGNRPRLIRRTLMIMLAGLLAAQIVNWVQGVPLQAIDGRDAGDLLTLAFPLLAIFGALGLVFWNYRKSE